jgi:predicted transcriptional regulator
LKKLFKDLYIFEINRDFWLNHSIESIPRDSFRNSYLLKDSVFVESDEHNLSKSFTKYLELLSNCGNMEIILPIFLEEHLEIILENLENGDNLLLITNDEVLSSLRNSKYYGDLADFSKKGQVIIRKVDYDLKVFLTICDEFMSLSLFFKDGLFDNSCFILNEHSDGIKWAKSLFEKFFEKSVRVI